MKDEIKEILDKLIETSCANGVFLTANTRDKIIDYITTLQEENETLKARIDKANKILGQILVVRDWEHKGRFRPVKNTTRQEVYATIVMLNELLETPNRASYGLLQGDDNNAKD